MIHIIHMSKILLGTTNLHFACFKGFQQQQFVHMMLGIFGTSLTLDRQDPQSELPLFESAYFEALDYTSQTQLDLTAVVENLLHGRNPHFRQFSAVYHYQY